MVTEDLELVALVYGPLSSEYRSARREFMRAHLLEAERIIEEGLDGRLGIDEAACAAAGILRRAEAELMKASLW